MKMYVCAIYDRKVAAFMVPQCFRTKGEAMRSFMDSVRHEASQIKRYAEDYSFFYLASYEDNTGQYENAVNGPEPLMSAVDALAIEGNVN